MAISSNVRTIEKSRRLLHALAEERHSALVVGLRFPTWACLESFGSGTRAIQFCDPLCDDQVRSNVLRLS